METGEKDVKKKSEGKKWGGGQCIKFPTDCKLYIIIVKYFEQIVNNEHYLVNVVVISIMRNYIHVTNKNRHKYHKQELEFYPSYTSQISIMYSKLKTEGYTLSNSIQYIQFSF